MAASAPFACALVRAQCDRERSETKGSANLDEQFWLTVEKADVVYVGETHDDPADHRFELDLVRGLVKRKVQFAIGWEMFDETQQAKLDAWAADAISLKEMLAETDFAKHWGIYSPAYEQILQIAGKAGVPEYRAQRTARTSSQDRSGRTTDAGGESDGSNRVRCRSKRLQEFCCHDG